MINRPKPPPHILKRLKEEEERKKAKKAKRKKFHNQTYYKDTKNMTANNFVKDLNPETKSESHHTQYPFKPTLNKIKEENEDNEQPYASGKKPPRHLDFHPKRGKSVINKAMNSNGFSRSGINNSTSYQSNFNDAAFSTSSSKNFLNSPHHSTIESRKAAKRADSLVARSATYSNVPCPHCDRKFSQAAAERHVPICQSIIAKPIGLRKSSSKRTSVQLPHLSQTSYKQGGFESSLMNNTSSTFRSTEGKFHKNFQNAGLPPTHKSSAKSAGLGRAKNNFQIKRAFCSCCGDKFRNRDKFCSSCGEKRII